MRWTALVLVVAQLGAGCSFAFVSGPPPNHPQLPYFDCTSSRVAPVLDGVWTALQTLNLLAAATTSDADWEENFKIDRQLAMGLYGGFAALGLAGFYYGWTRTSECRAAKTQLRMRAGGGGMAPMPGTWPPPQPPPAPLPPAPPSP